MLIASLTLRFTAHPPSEPPRPARPGAPVGPRGPAGSRPLCGAAEGRRTSSSGSRARPYGGLPPFFPARSDSGKGRRGTGAGRRQGGTASPHAAGRTDAAGALPDSAAPNAVSERTADYRRLRGGQAPAHPQGPRRRLGPVPHAAAHAGAAGDRSDMAQEGDDENGPPHGEAARMRPTGARRDRGSGRSRASRRRARGRPRAEARRPRRPRPPRARRSRARAYGCSR